MEELVDWKQKLKDKGLRCTTQRLNILRVLSEAERPLGAQEILEELKDDFKLRLSTIYRTLNSFTTQDIVRKLNFGDRVSKFELEDDNDHHHHLICIECGQVVALSCPLHKFEQHLSQETGYDISDHRIKFYGVCPECKKSK